MLDPNAPALVLAPMDGITDAPMRAFQGESGAFTYAVSEFIRVSGDPLPAKVFLRDVPEIGQGCRTSTGLPVQVQILGGHPERMARSASTAVRAGATAIDINFGCPAPTVNRSDGGASLLRHPERIRQIVAEVRAAVPAEVPVSVKLRLGWDDANAIYRNAEMAAKGGASWLTIHARTRVQGYAPPVFWKPIGRVREALDLPVVANGDIWTIEDFRRCRDETGCRHFMIGRSALANPALPYQIAQELGTGPATAPVEDEWVPLMRRMLGHAHWHPKRAIARTKQWLSIAHRFGGFELFDQVKHASSVEELFERLQGVRFAT
ncbi:MAG TPA: tRNA-dihydrouridine synthase family protein [Fimbriimonas sp.]